MLALICNFFWTQTETWLGANDNMGIYRQNTSEDMQNAGPLIKEGFDFCPTNKDVLIIISF